MALYSHFAPSILRLQTDIGCFSFKEILKQLSRSLFACFSISEDHVMLHKFGREIVLKPSNLLTFFLLRALTMDFAERQNARMQNN